MVALRRAYVWKLNLEGNPYQRMYYVRIFLLCNERTIKGRRNYTRRIKYKLHTSSRSARKGWRKIIMTMTIWDGVSILMYS